MMLYFYSVIFALIAANFVLSVDAIRCHQCNSHFDEDCVALRLSTPRAPLDTNYLKDCDNGINNASAFCRKTTVTIEVTGEHRIVRSCGWLRDESQALNLSCFTADNEGFLQTICACQEDGCNAATQDVAAVYKMSILAMGVCLLALMRHSA